MRRNTKKKALLGRTAFWVVLLCVTASFGAGWYLRHLRNTFSPRFEYLLVSVNGSPQKVGNEKTLRLHPADRVRILKVVTSVPMNFRIRLVSEGVDAEALQFDEMRLADILPGGRVFDHHTFRIWVKFRNDALGCVDWMVQPYPEDWMDEADRISDPDRRVFFLERAHRFLPQDLRIGRRLLDEYRSSGRWGQAAAMLEQTVAERASREVLEELLEIYEAMSRKDGIVSVWKRIVEWEPDDLRARIELAGHLEERGEKAEAVRQYEEILKRADREGQLAVSKQLAYLYTESGDYPMAVEAFLRAAELDEKDPTIYYNLSFLYEKMDQGGKARIYLAKALSLQKDDVQSRMKLAQEFMEKGRLQEARQYLEEALERRPESLAAWIMMADLMDRTKDRAGLINAYEKILDIDPENETVIYNLAAVKYEGGDMEGSLPYFETYLKYRPEDASVHGVLFDIYRTRKDAPLAFKQAMILIELKPKDMGPYHYIFQHLSSTGEYDKMIPLMKRGIERNPLNTDLREYQLVAYLKTGNEDMAIVQMEELLKMKPRDADLWLHLARLRERKGRFKEALQAYRQVIELSPGQEEAGEAYLQLRLKGIEGDD